MSKQSKRTRDAKTGKFLSDGTERRRPATTVRETVKVGPTKKESKNMSIFGQMECEA